MNSTKMPDLWKKLDGFHIDSPEADLSFEARLARENAWTVSFARRVVREYKRYLYLVATADSEMTPSDQVDQAWHLHLTYTLSYWKDLCTKTLGFEIHHLPTKGGPSERKRFREQYANTLATYEATFNESPPADIWPSVEQRFADVQHFVRLNRRHAWIVRKPSPGLGKLAGLAAMPFVLASCGEAAGGGSLLFWVLLGAGGVGALIFYKWMWGQSEMQKEQEAREQERMAEVEANKKEGAKGAEGSDGGDAGCGGGCGGG